MWGGENVCGVSASRGGGRRFRMSDEFAQPECSTAPGTADTRWARGKPCMLLWSCAAVNTSLPVSTVPAAAAVTAAAAPPNAANYLW